MTVAVKQGLRIVAGDGDPVADLDPIQGMWTKRQYLRLTDYCRLLIEFNEGSIEVLPMPTDRHQVIMLLLLFALDEHMRRTGGKVLCAPLRLQTGPDSFREPDLLLERDANDPRRQNSRWRGADLVAEIVSPDDPERDTVVKRAEYAEAGIPEYWIVDPEDETIAVLRLAGEAYATQGVFRRGDVATSASLAGFSVAVSEVFDAR